MSDQPTALSPTRKKKLPFKQRAVKQPSSGGVDGNEDDGLALFRRSSEMAPILAAEQERRLKRELQRETVKREEEEKKEKEKQQKIEEEEARARARAEEMAREEKRKEKGKGKERAESLIATPGMDENDGFRHDLLGLDPVSRAISLDGEDLVPTEGGSSSVRRTSRSLSKSLARQSVGSGTPPPKRTRLDSTVSDLYGSRPTSTTTARTTCLEGSPRRRDTHSSSHMNTAASASRIVITLDSDSEDDVMTQSQPPLRAAQPPHGNDGLDESVPTPQEEGPLAPEEDEFAEYVRKAQEKRDRERALLQQSSSGGGPRKVEAARIRILSNVPGTKPLIIKYRLGQPLVQARRAWINAQINNGAVFPSPDEDDIVLTWRGRKVYAQLSLRDLEIQMESGDETPLVQLDAWTVELFNKMEEEKEQRRRRDAGELSSDDDDRDNNNNNKGEGSTKYQPPPEADVKLRVILKARNFDDVKLRVLPETTTETLITGFRTQRNVANNYEVSLWFDGARLEEHTTMEDADIDDMDNIDVHVK